MFEFGSDAACAVGLNLNEPCKAEKNKKGTQACLKFSLNEEFGIIRKKHHLSLVNYIYENLNLVVDLMGEF